MKVLIPFVSYVALALVFAPAVAYLAGAMEKSTMTTVMLAGTIAWFGSVPFWMEKESA